MGGKIREIVGKKNPSMTIIEQSTMETKAKVDVESGAVAQSLVDNRGSNIKVIHGVNLK